MSEHGMCLLVERYVKQNVAIFVLSSLVENNQQVRQWVQCHGAYPVAVTCPKCQRPCTDAGDKFRCQKTAVVGKRKRTPCN